MENGTGIIRRIDELGRVVIPKELRHTLNIHDGDAFEIFVDKENQSVTFKKYNQTPIYKRCRDALEEILDYDPSRISGDERRTIIQVLNRLKKIEETE